MTSALADRKYCEGRVHGSSNKVPKGSSLQSLLQSVERRLSAARAALQALAVEAFT